MTKFPEAGMTRPSRLEEQSHRASTWQSRAEDNRDKQQRIFNGSLLELGSVNAKAGQCTRKRVKPLMEILQSAARHNNRWVVWQSSLFWV